MRGIQQDCIRSRQQGCRAARGIAGIALENIGEQRGKVTRFAARRQFQHAAAGALKRCRRHIDFHLRLRADHRADIAPVEHRTLRAVGKLALRRNQLGAHRRHGSNPRGSLAHFAGAQHILVEIREGQRAGSSDCCGFVFKRVACIQQRQRCGAIQQAGIEMRQMIVAGQTPRQRAFA